MGGLSGPAVLPIAVRMVWQTAQAVKIPICGMGGVSRWEDALELILAGASTVQIGAALFANPMAPLEIIQGLSQYLDEHHIPQLADLIGAVEPY